MIPMNSQRANLLFDDVDVFLLYLEKKTVSATVPL